MQQQTRVVAYVNVMEWLEVISRRAPNIAATHLLAIFPLLWGGGGGEGVSNLVSWPTVGSLGLFNVYRHDR